jgi:hypothetical protein
MKNQQGESIMRRQNCTFLLILAVLLFGMLSANVYAVEEKPAET